MFDRHAAGSDRPALQHLDAPARPCEHRDAGLDAGQQTERVAWPLGHGTWQVLVDSADQRWQGPGSQVPQRLESEGEVEVRLAARSAVLLVREG